MTKTIAILGCGWLGLPLLEHLTDVARFDLRGSSRRPETRRAIAAAGGAAYDLSLPTGEALLTDFLKRADVLILTLPPGGRRHGERTTEVYLEQLASLTGKLSGKHIIYTSSTGVYGDATELVTEATPPAPVTHSGRAVLAAEEWLTSRTEQLTILRLAGLIGPGRHPGNFYGGKERVIPQADAPVNLVHRDDVISAITKVIQNEQAGTFNVCAPEHPAKKVFYTAAAAALGLEVAGAEPGGAEGKIVDGSALGIIYSGLTAESL